MKARSSSYHALGRATGHVRRTSRTAAEMGSALSSGATSPNSALESSPSWLDFSPRGPDAAAAAAAALPPPRAAHKRARSIAFVPGAVAPAANVVLRHNKSAQRMIADARVAVKARTRAMLPRRVVLGLIALFFCVALLLFLLLQRLYGMHAPPVPRISADARSNERRIERGLEPLEYWPFRFRTRLRHGTPMSRRLSLAEALAVRNRRIGRREDYRASDGASSTFVKRVSLIAACKDRTGFVQTALPTWVAALSARDEIVLVDWGTSTVNHVPLMAVVEAIGDRRITLITLRKVSSWMLTRAYNLALAHARGQWILKMDCDHTLSSNFLDLHTLPPKPTHSSNNSSNSQSFYYRNSRDVAQNNQHTAGAFLAHSADLRAVHAYDERIVTYGWEDADLYKRLERPSSQHGRDLAPTPFVDSSVRHVRHGDALRLSDQKLTSGTALEAQINRVASLSLPQWATQERCTYTYQTASNDGRYLFATPQTTVQPALDQLSAAMREEVLTEARTRLLHNEYVIPLDVLSEITRSRAQLVREFDQLQRDAAWPPTNGVIFAHITGAPAQRLLGVASAAALALEYHRPLFVAWDPQSNSKRNDPRPDAILDFPRAAQSGLHVFVMGTWRCKSALSTCANIDPAYQSMIEYSYDSTSTGNDVLYALQHASKTRENILLRLNGAFSPVSRQSIINAMRLLRPAPRLDSVLNARTAALRGRHGIYLAPKLRSHTIEAFARRLRADTGHSAAFFVAGPDRPLVRRARRALNAQLDLDAGTQHFDPDAVQFGELFALALCQTVVNDGRTPRVVLDLVDVLRDALYSHQIDIR